MAMKAKKLSEVTESSKKDNSNSIDTDIYKISLEDNQYMYGNLELPTEPGIYTIHAPTGSGKTYFMMRTAGPRGIILFPVKMVMNQQRSKAVKEGLRANIKQIEKITQAEIDEATSIHFDEAQLFYEGGFRYSDDEQRVDVGKIAKMIIEASKRIPVYMYSASAKRELYHFPVKAHFHVDKKFERVLNVVHINKDTGTKAKTSIQTFVDIIRMAYAEYGTKIICFLDSAKTLAIIKRELAKKFEQVGDELIPVVSLKSKIINSSTPEDDKVYKEIIESEKIGGCSVDVILATSSLEAGININDDVTIISEQADADRLFQRFGRARNKGNFILIAGNGSEPLAVKMAHGTEDEFERRLAKRCLFEDKKHALCCDSYSLYASRASQMRYAFQIVSNIKDKGYSPDFELNLDYSRTQNIQGSKKQLMDYMSQNGLKISDLNSYQAVDKLAKSMKCTTVHAEYHIEQYKSFMRIFDVPAMNKLINAPMDYVYGMLSQDSVNMIATLTNKRFSDKLEHFQKMITKVKQYIPTETDKSSLDEASDNFFELALKIDDTTPYRKLFRVLMGYIPDNGRLVAVDDVKRAEWWKCKNMPQAKNNKYNRRKNQVEVIAPVAEYHEMTKMNQVEVADLSLKEFKETLTTFDSMSSKRKQYDITDVKF